MSNARKVSGEGLRIARLLMVLSSLAPLFVLMAIRGNSLFPEIYFASACLALAILPSIFLWRRVRIARKAKDTRDLLIGPAEDHRSHVLVYLFATLLPFYREEIASCRDLLAMCAALGLIVLPVLAAEPSLHEPVLCGQELPSVHGVAAQGRQSPHWTGKFRADNAQEAFEGRRTDRRIAPERHRLSGRDE